MQFTVKSGAAEKQRSACVIVGVFEGRKLTEAAAGIDEAAHGYITSVLRRGDLQGKAGQGLVLHNVPGTLADRVVLIGCGKERELDEAQFRKAVSTAVAKVKETGAADAVIYLPELQLKGRDVRWKVRQTVEIVNDGLYRFDRMKSKKAERRRSARRWVLNVRTRRDLEAGETGIREGLAVTHGVQLAKDLGNLPPNICTPAYLADQAKELGRGHRSLKVTVLDKAQMEKMGMNTLLAVARGSRQPPKLITIEYQGRRDSSPPVALVGKGVTFDSGGISIKPSAAMDEMKYDMCGAASVLGTMAAVAELKLPINVVGVIPTVENMPGGDASRPADIITSLSGQTVEILNTDAEGRLILCDALTYAEQRFRPDVVIDIATLTGACVVALGNHATGLFSNQESLAGALLKAGNAAWDRAWQLPLWEDYQSQLDSPFADIANVGGREGGAITAACFLSRFTKKLKWAHLDIAGTAWRSGKQKGATGRPVPLLTQYLIDHSRSH